MKILVDNSYSRIEGATAEELNALRKLLSYVPKANQSYFSGRAFNSRRYILDKRGAFPTGLLPLVLDKYPGADVADNRKKPKTIITQIEIPFAPYPEQVSAAVNVIDRGIIVAPTGSGKSAIIALLIKRLNVSTLVVVPSLELKHQLTTWLTQVVKKGSWRVENVDALDHKATETADCVIIDEFHHSAASTYQKLNKHAWKNVYHRVGLTATPFRTDEGENMLLAGLLNDVVAEIKYHDAVAAGRIVPLEAYYIELPKQEVNGYTWAQVYSELVTRNLYRNTVVAHLMKAIDAPTLVLVKEIAHGNKLSELAGVPFANGQDGGSRHLIDRFNSKTSRTLIGTTGVLGEGVDTKPCEFVIIAGLGKSKTQFMQNVGRGFRNYEGKESCKVILFKDDSHKFTKEHFKAQVRYLKEEYGVIPVKLDFTIP